MGNRKYINTCCIACGKEAWAWWRDGYPLCGDCDYDSDKNRDNRMPEYMKIKERIDNAVGYYGYWIRDTRLTNAKRTMFV